MSFFSAILEKLGFGPPAQPGAPATAPASTPSTPPVPLPAPAGAALSAVDVVAKLEGLAASNPQKLDWKGSIVDLLKVLGLESSLEARKGLAAELGCPKEKMNDSAQMNLWLHKTVLQKLAENGGNIPKELL
ncbi:MAG: DUF3597 domain-containing protein [Candidatus Competibacteraceae bacterium]|nr:DUF3597 domain-containing protein [Candidatus Competibacteraceae bacterium]